MLSSDVLKVWHAGALVGELWQDAFAKIGFRYEPSWVREGFAISQQLPLTTVEYAPDEGRAHQFFVNLLPEAGARVHAVRDLKIPDNDFELLKAVGGECAGALSILPENKHLITNSNYHKLSDQDLKIILQNKGSYLGFTTKKNRPRLSLAGAQDKCLVYIDRDQYYLPEGASPSTHILKFELADYRNIPAYEYFLTQLAKRVGLPVVDCKLKQFDNIYYLEISRYDRYFLNNGKVGRLHQEDFCQALSVNCLRKYQQQGGPSFRDCYDLLQKVSVTPIQDAENLLKWQIFNVLTGNSDGHAKNLALIYDSGQRVRLAPFYDLVCTRAIARIDSSLALSVGDKFNPDRVDLKEWELLAEECHIGKSYLQKLLGKMAVVIIDQFEFTQAAFENQHGAYPALQRIRQVVSKQCKRLLGQLSAAT